MRNSIRRPHHVDEHTTDKDASVRRKKEHYRPVWDSLCTAGRVWRIGATLRRSASSDAGDGSDDSAASLVLLLDDATGADSAVYLNSLEETMRAGRG